MPASQRLYDLEPIEQIRREMKQQERARELHPDLRNLHIEDRRLLSRIWVAYVWEEGGYYPGVECPHGYDKCPQCDAGRWILQGFRRKPQRITWRAIKRIRRKLHVPRGATLQLVELWKAWRDGPPTASPQRYVRSTAPDVIDDEVMRITQQPRSRTRRFTKKSVTFGFGRKVKYVAIARPRDHHHTKYLFLGPLMAEQPMKAVDEAVALWQGMYNDHLEVHPISVFKKGVRRRMRNGSVRPGKSRLNPETMFADESLPLNNGGD